MKTTLKKNEENLKKNKKWGWPQQKMKNEGDLKKNEDNLKKNENKDNLKKNISKNEDDLKKIKKTKRT